MSTRVLIADDQALVRAGFRMLIEAQPDMQVVGEAEDGRSALEALAVTRADLVLMDVRMPGLDGVETTERLLATGSGPKVIVLTTFDLDEYVFAAIRAGASGFLLKDARPEDLIDAIRRTHAGESLFAPSILTRLVEHYVSAPRPPRPGTSVRGLTARESEVLALIGRGRSNDELAADLGISVKTVKTHITHLLAKLDARDRAQLVIAAYDAGLVRPR
jgi:DNA-binding NarL/FixJ family response regulator